MTTPEVTLKERLRSHSSEKHKAIKQTKHDHRPVGEIAEDMANPTSADPPSLTHLETLINNLTSAVNGIKLDITDLKASKSEKFSNLESSYQESARSISEALQQMESDSLKVKILTAVVIRQDNRIRALEKEMHNIQNAKRKSNVIITGLDEVDVKTQPEAKGKIQEFFKEKMGITDAIEVKKVDVIGQGPNKPLLVKLAKQDDKAKIFENVSNLKGKVNARKKLYFVSSDMLEREREQRKYFQHLVKENKLKDEKERLTIQMKRGKLFVNNDPVKQKVSQLTAQDILTLDVDELEEIHQTRMFGNWTP